MSVIGNLVRTPLASAIGWTLVHSLWEGAVIALALLAAFGFVRSPRFRYAAACAAMLAILCAAAITFVRVAPQGAQAPVKAAQAGQSSARSGAASGNITGLGPEFGSAVPWLAPLWMAGVLLFCFRHAACTYSASRLRRRGVCSAGEAWRRRIAELSAQVRLTRPVALLESSLADAPAVLGHLRPVILMPIGLLAGLPVEQIEAILLHELAHVRRCDYLVNVLQRCVEAVFFYHPAVWWISGVMRLEREHCCDDAVVAVTGNAHVYAAALTALENNRPFPTELAVAAKGGDLVKRVRRLLYPAVSKPGSTPLLAATALILASAMALFAWQPPAQQSTAGQSRAGVMTSSAMSSPYDKWLNQDVVYIISAEERAAFRKLTTDEERLKFIEQFWLRRDPTPDTAENEYKEEHYRRIAFANEHFASNEPGWKTDRGRLYIMYGPPDEIESHPNGSPGSPTPREEWLYRHIEGIGDEVMVEFTDPTGTGDYRMTKDPHPPTGSASPNFNSSERVRVPSKIQEKNLILRVEPIYPPLAMQARIQGVVTFHIVIGKSGGVTSVRVVRGHPLLIPAATEAVQQWVYKPTLLNGEPVEVETDVDVNFTLNK